MRPAGLPGVAERDDVVDIDLARAAAHERDDLRRVGVGREPARQDDAAVRPHLGGLVGEVSAEDVVAGVAPVAVRVSPRLAERVREKPVIGARPLTARVSSRNQGPA
jgi:hypothetical protein